jgi:alpha-galactosidase
MKRSTLGLASVTLLGLAASAFAGGADRQGKGPLKVFILAGQSNMQGYGLNEHIKMAAEEGESGKDFKRLLDAKGNVIERKDVWICYGGRKGNLTVGYGADGNKIGPEIGFGWEIGERLTNQVLLIKTAWGGHSLREKFLPPSAGGPGPSYTEMVKSVHEVLDHLKNHFPSYDGSGYELVGLVWHQAWNDMIDSEQRGESPPYKSYTERQAMLIKDLRKEFKTPGLLMTIGECGVGGVEGGEKSFRKAQEATALMPEFKKTVRFVPTALFWDADKKYTSNGGYHYNGSGRTYYRKGVAFALAMHDMMPKITMADLPKYIDAHSKPAYEALKAKRYPEAYRALKQFEAAVEASRAGTPLRDETLDRQENVLNLLQREIAGPVDLAVADIESLKASGDAYGLSVVFPSHHRAFKGIDAFDAAAGTLAKDLEGGPMRSEVATGKRFYDYIEKIRRLESTLKPPRPAATLQVLGAELKRFAEREKESVYGKAAAVAAERLADPDRAVESPAAYIQAARGAAKP